MSRNYFEINSKGVQELLKSSEVSAACREVAESVYSRVNSVDGYMLEQRTYPERTGWAVVAAEYPAIADNYSHNSLLKAVGK